MLVTILVLHLDSNVQTLSQVFFGKRNSLVDKIGLHCDDGRTTRTVGKHDTHRYDRSCPEGFVMTGFRARSHKTRYHRGIGGILLICSNFNDIKMSTNNHKKRSLHIFGDMRADASEWNCPKEQLLVQYQDVAEISWISFPLYVKAFDI